VKKVSGGREPLHVLQHGKFLKWNVYLPNVTPVLVLRRYMLFGLVPAEMEVGVTFLEIFQAEFEPLSQGRNLGDFLVGMLSPVCNISRALLSFENTMVRIEFQSSRLHRRAARLIPDEHQCIHFAQLHAVWDTAMAFCNSTSFLQCGRQPAQY